MRHLLCMTQDAVSSSYGTHSPHLARLTACFARVVQYMALQKVRGGYRQMQYWNSWDEILQLAPSQVIDILCHSIKRWVPRVYSIPLWSWGKQQKYTVLAMQKGTTALLLSSFTESLSRNFTGEWSHYIETELRNIHPVPLMKSTLNIQN